MLSSILKQNGAQELSGTEQKSIAGGGGFCWEHCDPWCVCNHFTGYKCVCD